MIGSTSLSIAARAILYENPWRCHFFFVEAIAAKANIEWFEQRGDETNATMWFEALRQTRARDVSIELAAISREAR